MNEEIEPSPDDKDPIAPKLSNEEILKMFEDSPDVQGFIDIVNAVLDKKKSHTENELELNEAIKNFNKNTDKRTSDFFKSYVNMVEENIRNQEMNEALKEERKENALTKRFWVHATLSGASFAILISYFVSANYAKIDWLTASIFFWVTSLLSNGAFSYFIRFLFHRESANDGYNIKEASIKLFHDISNGKHYRILTNIAYGSTGLGLACMLLHVSCYLLSWAIVNLAVIIYLHQQGCFLLSKTRQV